MVNPFLWLISTLIWTYIYIVIAAVVLSWLIAFNVVNVRNQFVAMVAEFLFRVTEPALRPIRNRMPNLGGIDLSPAVLIIALMFFEYLIYWLYGLLFLPRARS
jgi:YggT family protein